MYSKDEASQLKQEFWTAFGQYMSPVLSAEGMRVNWVNYKTGLKNVYFRMKADKRSAAIAIELVHPDAGIQELFFEQFKEYKNILQSALDETWQWELHGTDEFGKTISRICKQIDCVSIFNKNDWPTLISFFKPRIIALDEFWNNVKYGFDALK
jgi:plasmid rolling circle replication initiator protein Rep